MAEKECQPFGGASFAFPMGGPQTCVMPSLLRYLPT